MKDSMIHEKILRAVIQGNFERENNTFVPKSFVALQKNTIKDLLHVLSKVYNPKLDSFKKVFDEKYAMYLLLTSDILTQEKIKNDGQEDIKQRVINVLTHTYDKLKKEKNEEILDQKDVEWLKKIGFTREEITKVIGVDNPKKIIDEIKENYERYLSVFGDFKYIKEISLMSDGYDKLVTIKEKIKNIEIDFNGSHLSQIVKNEGWEEKLRYFEDKENMRGLKEIGFEASHLSQIVVNAGREEKLRYFEDKEKVEKLKEIGFEASHLSQIVRNEGREEKMKYFEDKEKMKELKEMGFNGYHLSQIVRNAGWEEKMKYFEDKEKMRELKEMGFNGSHLSQIVVNAGREEKLNFVLSHGKDLLKEMTHYTLAKIFCTKGWKKTLLKSLEKKD